MNISNLTFKNQVTITPSDKDVFQQPVFVQVLGTSGNVAVITEGGQHQIWALGRGEIYPVAVNRVLLTGTTATDITILYND